MLVAIRVCNASQVSQPDSKIFSFVPIFRLDRLFYFLQDALHSFWIIISLESSLNLV